ncbi:MAG: hypothetical protein AB1806_19155 [Acidobacteriota bacterium]
MTLPRGAAAGTTLIELLVATTVTLIALATILSVALPWAGGIHAIGEAADVQQRLRVLAVSLARAIQHSGAGIVVGPGARLPRPWPALLPCRWAPGQPACQPAADALTVLGLDAGLQLQLAEDMAGTSAPLVVALPPGCAADQQACRFTDGTQAAIVDASGARDEFVVTGVSSDGTLLTHAPATFSRAYRAGSVIGRTTLEAYHARADPGAGSLQLRSGRGGGDFPLLDGLAGIAIEYFGDPTPPVVLGTSGGRILVSYGPEPPRPGLDDPADAWGAGENCTFVATAEALVPRLPSLPEDHGGLTRLSPAALGDGPWCPDGGSAWRFDADLMRVRRVRLTLRVQAQSGAARGSHPRLFSRPGDGRNAGALVPDLEVSVDVALRNGR